MTERAILDGRFFLTSPLGAGDIAQAYDVRDGQNAHFLLEIIDAKATADPRAWALCQEQAHRADTLRTGLFARLLEAGVDPALGPYLLREPMPGVSLANRLTVQGRLTIEQTLKLLGRLATGLEEGHRAGLVHRGLAPWCVMVAATSLESARVGELGLAILRATVPAPWPGPLGWMSPAQAQGAPVSPAMDLHALALLAFFALTGHSLLRSVASGAQDPQAVWAEMIAPPRASERAAELGVKLPGAFDAVLGRAIAMQPTAPFGSALTLVQAMEEALRPPRAKFQKTLLMGHPVLPGPDLLAEVEEGWSAVPPPSSSPPPPPSEASAAPATPAPAEPTAAPATSAPAEAPPLIAAPLVVAAPAETALPPVPEAPPPPEPASLAPAQYASVSPPPAKRSRKGLWIGLGALLFVGTLAVGLVAGAFFFRPAAPEEIAPAHSAASAVPETPLVARSPAEPSAAPAVAAPSAALAPAAPSAAALNQGTVVFDCTPACRELDAVTCDEKPLKLDEQDRLELEAGPHRCVLSKTGYRPLKLRLTVKAGETERQKAVLVRESAAPAASVKPPCGTFINPCP